MFVTPKQELSIRVLTLSLLILECGCPSEQNTVEGVIGPNEITGLVQWNVPVPSCEARLIRPQLGGATVDERHFGRGQHTVQYVYEHRNSRNTFQLTCDVKIRMEGRIFKELKSNKIWPNLLLMTNFAQK